MKNISILICKFLAVVLVLSAVFATGGCSESAESSAPETTEQTSAQQTTSAGTQSSSQEDFDVKSVQYYDEESSDKFSGAWKITDGAGSEYSSFVYIFGGNGKASLVIGNMGYCSTYSLTIDEELGEDVFVCQLMFGINGEYTYEFSDSYSSVVLTNTEYNETSALERLENYSFVPEPKDNPVIDEALVGAWKSDNGIYYYFGSDGIMYSNSFGTMFTYYNYSAKDGTVNAVYDMNGEIEESYEYSLDGEKLTFDSIEYTKIDVSELI